MVASSHHSPGSPTRIDRSVYEAALHQRIRLVVGSQTLRQLAKLGDVSVETARRYMNGSMPSSEFLARLCDRLGLNAEWLLAGEGPMLLEGVPAEALKRATSEQLVGEIARKFDQLNDRVARIEVAMFAGSRGSTAPAKP